MVKGRKNQHILAGIVLGRANECLHACPHRRKIIHPPGSQELVASAKDFAALGIYGNKVVSGNRSEERRVGKECRYRWGGYQKKKNREREESERRCREGSDGERRRS